MMLPRGLGRLLLGLLLGSSLGEALLAQEANSQAAVSGSSRQTVENSDPNEPLMQKLKAAHGLSEEQMDVIRQIFSRSGFASQGNPVVTKHPLSEASCLEQAKAKNLDFSDAKAQEICGAAFMSPLYDTSKEKQTDAKTCIDQFEFPNIPCTYPAVWVRASEAAEICSAMGKRLCDAHEWEGACAGSLSEPDYDFASVKGLGEADSFRAMRKLHNARQKDRRWAYGPAYEKGRCAANSTKSDGCNGGDWKKCGSNTYPSGSFPDCSNDFKVYDLHGNAAEHMSLPVRPEQMTSRGGLGHTEMKGSWFIFDKYQAHEDWCRWRAPYWHGSKVADPKSHHNYHLGFRCCKSLK
jgi:hypothetical protein